MFNSDSHSVYRVEFFTMDRDPGTSGGPLKTPLNSPRKPGSQETPTKESVNIELLDISDNHICILCDKLIDKGSERCKLYRNVIEKTNICKKAEHSLSIDVQSIFYKSIVCRKCEREFSSLEEKESKCKESRERFRRNFEKARDDLKQKYERPTTKRMSNVTPVKAKKKISYGAAPNKENLSPMQLCNSPGFQSPLTVWPAKEIDAPSSKPKVSVSTLVCLNYIHKQHGHILVIS